MASFSELFAGTPARAEQIQRFSPEQQQAFGSLLQSGLSGMQMPQFDFNPIAQQARTQFHQTTVPTIAERFSSMGAQRSSAFPQLLSSAAADLEGNLASMGANYGMQQQQMNQQRMFDLLRLGLTPQFEPRYVESEPGFLQSAAAPTAQSLVSLLPLLTGGVGSSIMSGLSGLLSLLGGRGAGRS